MRISEPSTLLDLNLIKNVAAGSLRLFCPIWYSPAVCDCSELQYSNDLNLLERVVISLPLLSLSLSIIHIYCVFFYFPELEMNEWIGLIFAVCCVTGTQYAVGSVFDVGRRIDG